MFEEELYRLIDEADYEAATAFFLTHRRNIEPNYLNPENGQTYLTRAVISQRSEARNTFIQTLLAEPRFTAIDYVDEDIQQSAFEMVACSWDPELASIFIQHYDTHGMKGSGIYQSAAPEALVYDLALQQWSKIYKGLQDAEKQQARPEKIERETRKETQAYALKTLILERTLRYAIDRDDIAIFEALYRKNASVSTKLSDGTDPIELAQTSGKTAIFAWYRENCREYFAVKALIAYNTAKLVHIQEVTQINADLVQKTIEIARAVATHK